MWIDINAYIGHWPFIKLKYSRGKDLLERMEEYEVDVTVVSNLNSIFYKNVQSGNRELFDELNSLGSQKSKFIPFGVINPIYAGWQNDLKECINKFGMKGICLYPRYHDYDIEDPSLVELVKMARDMGVPVAFTYRMVDSRQRSWMDIDYVISTDKPEWSLKNFIPIMRTVPDAKYMILNISQDYGGFNLSQEDKQVFENANILFDTSGRALNFFPDFLKNTPNGIRRFAFGTHAPILDYLTGMLRIESLSKNEITDNNRELLKSGNAQRFLNI